MSVRRTAVIAAALLAAACTPVPPPGQGGEPAPRQDAASGALVSSLSVEAGDTVRLTLQVTNATTGALTLAFASGQSYDFAVVRGGETLWQWSADKRWIQALREETLAAGETRTFTEPWVPEGPARGEFTARGWLTSSSHPVESTATFRLP